MLDKKSAGLYKKQEEVSMPGKYQIIAAEAFKGHPKMKSLKIRHDSEYIAPWIINKAAKIRCYQGSKVDAYCKENEFEVEYL